MIVNSFAVDFSLSVFLMPCLVWNVRLSRFGSQQFDLKSFGSQKLDLKSFGSQKFDLTGAVRWKGGAFRL
jgi:hypothetical protein